MRTCHECVQPVPGESKQPHNRRYAAADQGVCPPTGGAVMGLDEVLDGRRFQPRAASAGVWAWRVTGWVIDFRFMRTLIRLVLLALPMVASLNP